MAVVVMMIMMLRIMVIIMGIATVIIMKSVMIMIIMMMIIGIRLIRKWMLELLYIYACKSFRIKYFDKFSSNLELEWQSMRFTIKTDF